MKTRRIALALGLVLLASGVTARDLEVTARVDRERARLGEPVELVLLVAPPDRGVVHLPVLGEELGGLTVLDSREDPPGSEDAGLRLVARLTAYSPGEQQIPPLEVIHVLPGGERFETATAAIPIRFELGPASSETPSAEQLEREPPAETYRSFLRWWWLLGGVALLALLTWAVVLSRRIRQARRRRGASREARRPPHEVALERLARLEEEDLIVREAWKAFCVRLADIVKEYVGGRYGFYARESTTDEVLAELERLGIEPEPTRLLTEILELCDRVKFARHRPTPGEVGQAIPTARRLVETGR